MFGLIGIGEYHKWKKRRSSRELSSDFINNLSALVVGGGSVGKRHLGNLLGLGVIKVAVVDPRDDRRLEIREHFGDIMTYKTEEEAYKAGGYDIVVVCNPPAFHIESADRAVREGAHVLIEKSISNKVEEVEDFLKKADKAGKVVSVCYMYRFFDTLKHIKELLEDGVLGKVFSAQMTFSEYLPDWHPWEKPSDWYASQKALGGSELLDENHTVDWARWFFGEITEVSGHVDRASNVTIDSDDFAEFTCFHDSGVVSQIHQDAFGRKPRKDMWIMGEKGTIFWDSYMGGNSVELHLGGTGKVDIFKGGVSRDEAFFDLLYDFLQCVSSGKKPVISGWDALKTLKVCAAVEKSSVEGKNILL